MKKCSYCGAEYQDEAMVCPVDHTPLDAPAPSVGQPHSRFGIASFIISIIIGSLMMACLCLGTILAAHRVPGEREYPGQTVVGLLLLLLAGMDVVALGLGIASLFDPGKNRQLGILGVVFSSTAMLGVFALMIIGLMYMRPLTH